MSILYQNLTKDLDIVLSEDKRYDRSTLLFYIKTEFAKSGVKVISVQEYSNSILGIVILVNDQRILLYSYIKNITGAGWANRPNVKRVQVSNMRIDAPEMIQYDTDRIYDIILGVYCYDDNPIFVAWDAYRYYNHNTIRSCYVTIEALKRGYEKGYNIGVALAQKIWVFLGERAKEFLLDYIEYSKTVSRKELK